MFTSAIRHPAKSSFIQIHEWQLAATGDKTAAALLSVFEHRHNAIADNREFDLLVRTSAEEAGFVLPPDFKFWFSFTDEQLIYRVKIAKKEAVYKGLDILADKGFIDRNPPEDLRELVNTGRRKWFLLNVDRINATIDAYAPREAMPTNTPPATENAATDAANVKPITMRAQCLDVFEDWKTVHESPRSLPDDKRLKLVERLLTLKPVPFTVDRLKLATRGICTLDHNMGLTNGRLYNQFELIFRDAAHVETYEAAATALGITVDNYREFTISKSDRVFRRVSANAAAAPPASTDQVDVADLIADALAGGTGVDAVIKMLTPEQTALVSANITEAVFESYRTYSILDGDAKKKIRTVIERIVKSNG